MLLEKSQQEQQVLNKTFYNQIDQRFQGPHDDDDYVTKTDQFHLSINCLSIQTETKSSVQIKACLLTLTSHFQPEISSFIRIIKLKYTTEKIINTHFFLLSYFNLCQYQIVEFDDSHYRQHKDYSHDQILNLLAYLTDLILLLYHFHRQQHDLLSNLMANT